jgi:hypothetical protein
VMVNRALTVALLMVLMVAGCTVVWITVGP